MTKAPFDAYTQGRKEIDNIKRIQGEINKKSDLHREERIEKVRELRKESREPLDFSVSYQVRIELSKNRDSVDGFVLEYSVDLYENHLGMKNNRLLNGYYYCYAPCEKNKVSEMEKIWLTLGEMDIIQQHYLRGEVGATNVIKRARKEN